MDDSYSINKETQNGGNSGIIERFTLYKLVCNTNTLQCNSAFHKVMTGTLKNKSIMHNGWGGLATEQTLPPLQ